MAVAERRPNDVSIHEWQHKLIADRVAAIPARYTKKGHHAYREAYKRAAWNVRSHIQGEHSRRNLPVLMSVEELIALHDSLHAGEVR